jgi:hypothetical protein
MIKTFEDYTLLAGSHGRRGSIWRGPDHLLVVEGSGVLFALNESYRRIDYENIQALSLVRTQRYGWLMAAFSAPLVLMALILTGMVVFGADMAVITGVTLALGVPLLLVPFILLVIHLARGRTVRCTLQTAVQNLRLRPLTREAKAERIMAEITSICREFQAGVVPSPETSAAAAPPAWQAVPAAAWAPWNGSPAVIVAGVIAVLWGAVLGGELFVPGAGYLLLDGFLAMIAVVTGVIALVFAMRYHSPTTLQVALWLYSALGLLVGFSGLVGIGISAGMAERSGAGRATPTDAFQYLADLSMEETQGFGWIFVGVGILIAALGLAMLPYGMRRHPDRRAAAPPPVISG